MKEIISREETLHKSKGIPYQSEETLLRVAEVKTTEALLEKTPVAKLQNEAQMTLERGTLGWS